MLVLFDIHRLTWGMSSDKITMMSYFRNYLLLGLIFCFISGHSYSATQQNTAYKNFWHPTFHGERLDYCIMDGKSCGKPVADRFCQLLGYDYSSQNVIAYNIGLTHYLSSRAACKGWRCHGFMTIRCATRLSHTPPKPYHYREKKYIDPRFNGYRLDWCYNQNQDCGARAANSFCGRMGFVRAKQFAKEHSVSATQSIGSQALCFGEECSGFKQIICVR